MKYGLDMLIRQVREDGEAVAAVNRYLPGILKMTEGRPEAGGMSLRSLARYLGDRLPKEALEALGAELTAIGEKRGGISPAEAERIKVYQKMAADREAEYADPSNRPDLNPARYDAVHPGQVWLDTNGRRIQAHAGGIIEEDGTYYWYGENKEFTDGRSQIWTWGIRMYASKDFYNWEDLGLIIPPVLDDPNSPLFPEQKDDRPHIVKNARTGKYVCWIKLSGPEACFTILTADKLQGPYTIEKTYYNPLGMHIGDFDIAVNPENGRAYLYCEAEHDRVVGIRLTDDYLGADELVSTQYEKLFAPFCREGVTVLQRGGKLIMLTSGMSGYVPNQSDAAVAEGFEETFVSIGDPHIDDDSLSSFNSQISQAFRVPGKDEYITLADRWVPKYVVTRQRALDLRQSIASTHDAEHYPATPEQMKEMMASPMLESAETRIADYVFLPLTFAEDGRPEIRWQESWKI